MGIIRPATPGFLVTLAATGLLAVVSFCVPYFKSVYFLKANISLDGGSGTITFGTLGYCLELPNSSIKCSPPAIGYELDVNGLVGNNLPVQIPNVVVKWLTYCLFLHIIALGLAAVSAVFGLLAHVREMSMTCCSTCVSGFAATIALLAFVFDISIFFAAKARISTVGSAQLGNATWLTLAAWVLLFFSSTFFTLGRCCIARRPKRDWENNGKSNDSDQMQLDAIKAEADRKARQQKMEAGLPSFPEYQPLTGYIDGDKVVYEQAHKDNSPAYGGQPVPSGGYAGGGYARAPAGTRAVDDYYNNSPTSPTIHHQKASSTYSDNNSYTSSPPGPQRRPSGYARSSSAYTPSVYTTHTQSASPLPLPTNNAYLGPPPQMQQYGHGGGGSSYSAHSHAQQPTNYSNYDPYDYRSRGQYNTPPQQQGAQNSYDHGVYYNTPTAASHAVLRPVPEGNYTLGGTSYGGADVYDTGISRGPLPLPGETPYAGEVRYNNVAQQHQASGVQQYVVSEGDSPYDYGNNYDSSHYPAAAATGMSAAALPSRINTQMGNDFPEPHRSPAATKGLRSPGSLQVVNEDAPPTYEPGTSVAQGHWGKPTAH